MSNFKRILLYNSVGIVVQRLEHDRDRKQIKVVLQLRLRAEDSLKIIKRALISILNVVLAALLYLFEKNHISHQIYACYNKQFLFQQI